MYVGKYSSATVTQSPNSHKQGNLSVFAMTSMEDGVQNKGNKT
jgi:hypothetical protein